MPHQIDLPFDDKTACPFLVNCIGVGMLGSSDVHAATKRHMSVKHRTDLPFEDKTACLSPLYKQVLGCICLCV